MTQSDISNLLKDLRKHCHDANNELAVVVGVLEIVLNQRELFGKLVPSAKEAALRAVEHVRTIQNKIYAQEEKLKGGRR